MGNTRSSTPAQREEEIVIHSFLLCAEYDDCQLPLVCPRKNAMFDPPTSLSENVHQFLELSEAQKIVADLNRILHRTAFNPKLTNPCFLLALLFYFMFLGIVLPLLLRFSLNEVEEEPSTRLYWYIRRMVPFTSPPKGFHIKKNIVSLYFRVLGGGALA